VSISLGYDDRVLIQNRGMGLDSISNETISLLSELAPIPGMVLDVPFLLRRDPRLYVYLSNNRLQRIPGAIFNLEHITNLSLRGNGLRELPPSIAKLKNLVYLNVSQNRLRYLPAELLDLISPLIEDSKLSNLLIHPNPFYQPSIDKTDEPQTSKATVHALAKKHAARLSDLARQAGSLTRGVNQQRYAPRFLVRSPVQYSDSSGTTYSEFRLPGDKRGTVVKKYIEISGAVPASTPTISPYHSKSSSQSTIASSAATKVPSLLEVTLRSCHNSPRLAELAACLPEEPYSKLRGYLDLALQQREEGGLECSKCRRMLVVPATQWIEWLQIMEVEYQEPHLDPLVRRQSERYDEQCVPFLRRGCSWKCLPWEYQLEPWIGGDEKEAISAEVSTTVRQPPIVH
jgi:hypothetical protein